jgi:hypothetical protein
MVLGSVQSERVTTAAKACAQAIKRTAPKMRTALIKVFASNDPERIGAALVDLAFKASADSRLSARTGEAIQEVQGHFLRFVEVWAASPSGKHKDEMVKLFRTTLKKPSSR